MEKMLKPRAKFLNDVLRSKKGGRHSEKLDSRSQRKHQARKEINQSLKGSLKEPFLSSLNP